MNINICNIMSISCINMPNIRMIKRILKYTNGSLIENELFTYSYHQHVNMICNRPNTINLAHMSNIYFSNDCNFYIFLILIGIININTIDDYLFMLVHHNNLIGIRILLSTNMPDANCNDTLINCVIKDHDDIFEILLDYGCICDESVIKKSSNNSPKIMKLLLKRGYEYKCNVLSWVLLSTSTIDINCVKILLNNRYRTKPSSFYHIVQINRQDIACLLMDYDIIPDPEILDVVKRYNMVKLHDKILNKISQRK